jgi:hypothetical protein
VNALLGALVFGCLVYLATMWCARFARLGERTGALGTQALQAALCSAAAIAGGALLAHNDPPATILAIAILCVALGATCFLAALGVPVPPAIPGTALAILIGSALLRGDAGPLAGACTTGAPFAATAFFAPRSGADWRDAVVAALGGAAFGLPLGLVAAGFACLSLALARPYLARYRTTPQPRASFAPALAGTFLVALVGELVLS